MKFQLTRSRGAWLNHNRKTSLKKYFNSHAHVERDLAWSINRKIQLYFNSHAHVERDSIINDLSTTMTISTHTLTWSVTLRRPSLLALCKFQLTRSRGAWPSMLCISGACSTWCGLIFLFNGYRFDFVHCAFTNSMVFSCELTKDLWITWGTLVKILGRLRGHRSLWCRSVLLYASNCCLSNISADYHAFGLLFSEVYLSLSEKCHSLRLFQTRCSALADHNFDTLSTLF